MAVGSRAHLEADALARRHWFRNFLMRGFHLLVMFVAGGTVRDSQCGFKACRSWQPALLLSYHHKHAVLSAH